LRFGRSLQNALVCVLPAQAGETEMERHRERGEREREKKREKERKREREKEGGVKEGRRMNSNLARSILLLLPTQAEILSKKSILTCTLRIPLSSKNY